jgi:hypothetical protein
VIKNVDFIIRSLSIYYFWKIADVCIESILGTNKNPIFNRISPPDFDCIAFHGADVPGVAHTGDCRRDFHCEIMKLYG